MALSKGDLVAVREYEGDSNLPGVNTPTLGVIRLTECLEKGKRQDQGFEYWKGKVAERHSPHMRELGEMEWGYVHERDRLEPV